MFILVTLYLPRGVIGLLKREEAMRAVTDADRILPSRDARIGSTATATDTVLLTGKHQRHFDVFRR
ncbi:MAG: hypothetical protein QM805_27500 [Pseudomonas sp.]